MTFNSAREHLADLLTAQCPHSWRLIAAMADPDSIQTVTLVLYQGQLSRAGLIGGRTRVDLDLWILRPQEEHLPRAETRLEAALETVIDILDTVPAVIWDKAERVTYLDRFPGYKLTLSTIYEKD